MLVSIRVDPMEVGVARGALSVPTVLGVVGC